MKGHRVQDEQNARCGPARSGGPHRRLGTMMPILCLCGALCIAGLTPELAQARQSGGPAISASFLSGMVTSNVRSRLHIDNKYYEFHEGATMTNDEGRVIGLEDLVPGALVQFHLRNGKIDQIILLLPR